jgi:hypothetical protein
MENKKPLYTLNIEETFVTAKDNKNPRRSYVAARMYAQGEMNPVNSWTIVITDETGSRSFDRRTNEEQHEELVSFMYD